MDGDGAPLNFTQLMAGAEGDLSYEAISTEEVDDDGNGGFTLVMAPERRLRWERRGSPTRFWADQDCA